MSDPNTYPVWDGTTDNAMIYGVFESAHKFDVGFNTDADTLDARTGLEYAGVQFVDLTDPGYPDMIGILSDSTRPIPDFKLQGVFAEEV